jgi:IS1 family transposase
VTIDWSLAKTKPRQHQIAGTQALIDNLFFALFDQVGAGKTKQVIDAAQALFMEGVIDTVVVVAPAFARVVWANPDPMIGEIAKHGWDRVQNDVVEYSTHRPKDIHRKRSDGLTWIVTNYEFVRRDDRLADLQRVLKGRRVWLVCDEGWALKDHSTKQWKACNAIRVQSERVVILNGTPIADNPLDLYAQMRLLHPKILCTQYRNLRGKVCWTGYMQFRARYAILKPNVSFPLITGWQNLEELREKIRPFVLRRETRDCFDLPEILDPVTIEVKLTDSTWAIYRQMRDDMVVWLDKVEKDGMERAALASQALVKFMRLSQITSGYLGGIHKMDPETGEFMEDPEPAKEISSEKIDGYMDWLAQPGNAPERLLTWCLFRAEVERCAARLEAAGWESHRLYGSQPKAEREAAVRVLAPEYQPKGRVAVTGNASAGGAALNLAGASLAATLSLDPKLRVWLQARGRIDRPGQVNKIRYVDVIATGPKGQRTIDHHKLAALRAKDDIARWTAATWRHVLTSE